MMDNIEDPTLLLGASELDDDGPCESGGITIQRIERPSFAARVRVIVLLSLLCWALLIAGAVLIID
jgi:hypothetical protein